MTRKILLSIVAVFACAGLLAPDQASAAEMKFREVMYASGGDVKPVGDIEGHVAGKWERRGVCLMGKEVATYFGSGTLDMTKGKGTGDGKATCTFEDGSSHTSKVTMTFEPVGKGLVKWTGRAVYVEGTGRFEGIKGTGTFSGRSYTPMSEVTKSDSVVDVVSKYTVPKKPLAKK